MPNLLLLDCETGGVDAKVHSLLTVYAALVSPSLEIIQEKEWKVLDTPFVLNPQALVINNIDVRTFNQSNSVNLGQLGLELMEMVVATGSKAIPFGHRVAFDVGFLSEKCGGTQPYLSHNILDTAVIAVSKQIEGKLPAELKISLKNLGDHFKLDTSNCHDAKFDARLTLEVYKCLITL